MSFLFITGMPRSGTTLLDKLLSAHPQALILSQPLPLFYVELKRAFLASRGMTVFPDEKAFPMGDMIGHQYYQAGDFLRFLKEVPVEPVFFNRIVADMADYSGQYTKFVNSFHMPSDAAPTYFFELVDGYLRKISGVPASSFFGCKETFCEEFIPLFLDQGALVVMMIRDPRDVVTSLNYGRGGVYGGRKKPHLFNIRCWRKSAAFVLEYKDHPRFNFLLYETLVKKPQDTMRDIAAFLNLDMLPPEVFTHELKDQNGNIWESNSSHEADARIFQSSVGKYRVHLQPREAAFIEACCYPEMRALGYETSLDPDAAVDCMKDYADTLKLERPELCGYTWSQTALAQETDRLENARQGVYKPELFIFKKAFDEIMKALFSNTE